MNAPLNAAVNRPIPVVVGPDALSAVRLALASQPDGVLETVARDCGVPLRAVIEALPVGQRRLLPGAAFAETWSRLVGWGEVLVIVHTGDIVLEVASALPPGTEARGWFNIHGTFPLGGHIRADRCTAIALVDRLFHGRRSLSVQFLNAAGEAMFKVFVRRLPDKSLAPAQEAAFAALWGTVPADPPTG